MEIRQLRHFIAAAEAGNFRKASEKVHISHPALSMSIKNLEGDLGVTLFIKNRRGVQLTYAGQLFLKSAHSLLHQIDDVRASLQGTEESPTGNVRLGIPYGVNNALAAPLFKLLMERFPGINLEVEEGNTTSLERSYENNLLDLIINYDVIEKMDQKCEPLYIEHLYFVSGYDPELENVREIDLKSLEGCAIVSSPGTHSMRKTLDKYALDNGVTFNFLTDFKSAHSSIKITEASLANTISSWDLIHDYVGSKRVTARKIVNPEIERKVFLTSSLRQPPTAASKAIVGAIKEAIVEARQTDKLRGRNFFE